VLTVRDLISDLGVRALAGEHGLDLPVRWVHMTELLDPTPWLSGGEVLLTTGMQLDTPVRQREFTQRLADRQLAGLGFGIGFGHDHVPDAVLEVGQEHDFPVFEVPYELPFIAITEAAFSRLLNEQYAVLRRALAAQERLERIVLSERGLDALAAALAALVGASVLVFDGRGELLVHHAFRRSLEPDTLAVVKSGVSERSPRGDARPFMPGVEDPSRALALPVAADGAPSGEVAAGGATGPRSEAWLVAVKDGEPLSDFDRLTLRQAVTIVALELLRSRVAGDTERRLAGDVLAALLTGGLSGAELQRRLEPFGLSERVAAFVLRKPAGGPAAVAQGEAALAAALRAEAAPGLVATAGELTCALVPGLDEEELFTLAGRVARAVAAQLRTPVEVGVSRALAGTEARRSYHEARCALESLSLAAGRGAEANGNGNGGSAPAGVHASMSETRVATYRDLGSFQLLLSLQDDEALKLFCDSILGAIEQSEGHYGGELMRSLEAFIEENGQWERAAKRLYCHRHTLRYRIRRVEELTGRDLSSARDRIEFWLALRGRELVA
jgi:PucR family transcriptional regulator, purine catabolism regulatory protein